ncbi:hypothetical protein DVH05_022501 [Phytophthora capsici]|nr:hypothetical protein DVH05_022501 [Phytophthora capsici]
MFHHHATVSGLMPRTKYFYKVGSKTTPAYVSPVYSFTTARAATDNGTFNLVIYEDFGPGDQSKSTLAYVNSLTSDTTSETLAALMTTSSWRDKLWGSFTKRCTTIE